MTADARPVPTRGPAHAGPATGGSGDPAPSSIRRRGAAYLALTKPRVVELLRVTTVPTMILAAGGAPPLGLTLATLVGGSLAAGSANSLNCYLDRDIDAVMHRTGRRPLVTGELTPAQALRFGVGLGVGAAVWLALLVNVLSALLAVTAIAFYVGVYTLLLKRRTPQNIVWGGAAGCMPVLIGWSAVTGRLDWAALVLFGVIFLWTPPHYWPLSMRYRDDYATAGVPMLPVVTGDQGVARRCIAYSYPMVACSLLLVPVAPMGLAYTAVAVLAGGWFLWQVHALAARVRRGEATAPMRVFHGSITYLTLLFLAVAVDPFLPW